MSNPKRQSRLNRTVVVTLVIAAALALTAWSQLAPTEGPEIWTYEVVASFPHDTSAFTQGLTIYDGRMYEGTGQYRRSSLRRTDIQTGRVEEVSILGDHLFGEGIAIHGDRIFQLTWMNNLVFVYDVDTFARLATLRNEGQGWGLTHDGRHLLVSDGTATIRFHDPETFELISSLDIHEGGNPITNLNELEYVNGEIWANIWYQDRLARISPDTGAVVGWIDLSTLYPASQRTSEHVLNGIAYDADSDRLFVTGKNWPRLYEIEVGPP
ncbi:MAG: glutaminyl-peptide cyclotransferase [Candidatus Rariloculaceae bacterium]